MPWNASLHTSLLLSNILSHYSYNLVICGYSYLVHSFKLAVKYHHGKATIISRCWICFVLDHSRVPRFLDTDFIEASAPN